MEAFKAVSESGLSVSANCSAYFVGASGCICQSGGTDLSVSGLALPNLVGTS